MPKPLKPTPYTKDWKAEDDRILEAIEAPGDIEEQSISSLDRQIDGRGRLLKGRLKRLPKTRKFLIDAGILIANKSD